MGGRGPPVAPPQWRYFFFYFRPLPFRRAVLLLLFLHASVVVCMCHAHSCVLTTTATATTKNDGVFQPNFNSPNVRKWVPWIGVGMLLYYVLHISYMWFVKFDYGYNMKVRCARGSHMMLELFAGYFVRRPPSICIGPCDFLERIWAPQEAVTQQNYTYPIFTHAKATVVESPGNVDGVCRTTLWTFFLNAI